MPSTIQQWTRPRDTYFGGSPPWLLLRVLRSEKLLQVSSLASKSNPMTHDEVTMRIDVLRAIWTLIVSRQNDALAANVAELGQRLVAARDAEDWAECREIISETRQWIATFSGVVMVRTTSFFDQL